MAETYISLTATSSSTKTLGASFEVLASGLGEIGKIKNIASVSILGGHRQKN